MALDYKAIFGTPLVDVISERTSDAGVTVDGVLLKDGQVSTDVVNEATGGVGVTIDSVLLKDGQVSTDVINELTGAAGVTIDSVLLKDGYLALSEISAPALIANKGILYTFTDNELYYKDESNNDVQITAGGVLSVVSRWDLDGTDIFNNNAGNVGVGTHGTGTVDELLHVSKAVDDGDVAVLIENAEAASVAITETASLKFGFGGNNSAGLIQIGKVGDFVLAADRDSYMAFSVLNSDASLEAMRIVNSGDIGLGNFSSATIDERLHIAESVDGDVAVLIENSLAADAGTNETASLKFGFGGNNNAGLIQVGKVNDFVLAADRDSFMAFSVLDANVVVEAMRLEAGASNFAQFAGFVKVAHLAAAPTQTASFGTVYVLTSDEELYFKDASGNATQITADGALSVASRWTLATTDIFNNNAGHVGVGPGIGAGTIDEQLHIAESVDGGDIAALIENSFTNTAASIDETASLKFGFGGNNGAASIVVGKIGDYTSGANEDSVMRISVDNIGSLVELLTLKGGPATTNQIANIGINEPDPTFKLYITGNFQEDTRMVIDSTDGGGNALVSFTKQAMAASVDIGITSQFIMQEDDSSAPGVFFSRSLTNGNMEINNGAAVDINTASLKQKVAGTPTFSFTLQNETTTIFWQLLAQGTTRFGFSSINRTIYRIPQSSGNFVISEDIIAGEHLTSAKQVDGDFVAALLLNNQASGAASTNETVKLRFGFGTLFNVAEISVGKVNDYVIAADQDSFMAFSVDVGGVLTETLRLSENTGVANVGVGDFSSVTIDEILHVGKAVSGDVIALLLENTQANDAGIDEIVSLAFGFGGINDAAEIEVGKIGDFQTGAAEDAFMRFMVANNGTLAEVMRIEGGDVAKWSVFGVTATARDTGWTTFANLASDKTLDADATSDGELADVLGTLIEELKTKGILAA